MQAILLSLADNQLSGTVPYIPKVEVLLMRSNRFTEARFDAMPVSLQLLYLSNNSLSSKMLQLGSSTSHSADHPRPLMLLKVQQQRAVGEEAAAVAGGAGGAGDR